jgi:hypothetical protein
MLYLTDDFGAAVRKCTPQGNVVLTIGTPGKPAPRFSGDPFNGSVANLAGGGIPGIWTPVA